MLFFKLFYRIKKKEILLSSFSKDSKPISFININAKFLNKMLQNKFRSILRRSYVSIKLASLQDWFYIHKSISMI